MQDSFRIAGNISEFFSELKSIKSAKSPLKIWQTIKNKKHLFEGHLFDFENEKKHTIVSLELLENSSFDPVHSIYIFDDERGILFKGTYEYCVSKRLKIIADEKVYLREKRKVKRYNFHYNIVNINLSISNQIDLEGIQLKDISEYGFSCLLKDSICEKLKVDQEISLVGINGLILPRKINGVLAHKSKNSKRSHLHVGVKFKQKSKLIGKIIEQL